MPDPHAQPLLDDLDEHLAALNVLFHQYVKHDWLSGKAPPRVRRAFALGHAEVLAHTFTVARHVLALGGVPVSSLLEFVNRSYLAPEPEGPLDVPDMLGHDITGERLLLARLAYSGRAARRFSLPGTGEVLGEVRRGSARRLQRLERLREDH